MDPKYISEKTLSRQPVVCKGSDDEEVRCMRDFRAVYRTFQALNDKRCLCSKSEGHMLFTHKPFKSDFDVRLSEYTMQKITEVLIFLYLGFLEQKTSQKSRSTKVPTSACSGCSCVNCKENAWVILNFT